MKTGTFNSSFFCEADAAVAFEQRNEMLLNYKAWLKEMQNTHELFDVTDVSELMCEVAGQVLITLLVHYTTG